MKRDECQAELDALYAEIKTYMERTNMSLSTSRFLADQADRLVKDEDQIELMTDEEKSRERSQAENLMGRIDFEARQVEVSSKRLAEITERLQVLKMLMEQNLLED